MSDYRDADKPKTPPPQTAIAQSRWFTRKGNEIADGITADLVLLRRHQQQRLMQYVVSTRLYGNLPPLPFGGLSTVKLNDRIAGIIRERISFNIVASVIETITAKISKNRPRPWFLTSGGDYRQQRRAKGLTKFVDGVFYENDADAKMSKAQLDSCVYGDALIKVFPENGRVKWERTLAVELYTDEMEGYYGNPRSLHQVKDVDKGVLKEAWPDFEEEIDNAPAAFQDAGLFPIVSDMVQVRESWHLPSGPDAKDGRHCISIEGCVLTPEDEQEWEHDYFPFARLTYADRLYGYWGQGAAERLQPIQLRINKSLNTISISHDLAGTFKILTEKGSKIVKEHFNNDVGTVVDYVGTPPQYILPPIVQPEVYQEVATQIQRAYEQEGVSQLSAASKKPEGLDSGKALREMDDIESDRFTLTYQQYERLSLNLARLSIECVKDITRGGKRYRVSAPVRGRTVEMNWSEVKLDEDQYVMKCFPISALSRDPVGRTQDVQELMQAGVISSRTGQKLLDFPDLEQYESLATAMEDHLTDVVERMAYDGDTYEPEPYDDLALAKEIALETYARGHTNGLEEERMEMLRVFMSQIDEMNAAAQAAAMPPAGPAGAAGAPQAVPAAPPVSQILPNAPAAQA